MDSVQDCPRATRKSLPLTERDMRELALLRTSDAHREALSRLAGADLPVTASEAAFLHAVMEAGLQVVREQVETAGYAALAAERGTATSKAVARRRRPTWANE